MKNILYGLIAWACLAVGFIPRLLEKDHPRKRADPAELVPKHEGEWPRWFHWFKNWGVTVWGSDNQWWFKFHTFIELLLVITVIVLIIF